MTTLTEVDSALSDVLECLESAIGLSGEPLFPYDVPGHPVDGADAMIVTSFDGRSEWSASADNFNINGPAGSRSEAYDSSALKHVVGCDKDYEPR